MGSCWGLWVLLWSRAGSGCCCGGSSSSAEGSQPVLLVWDTWGCCPCSEGSGCGQVQETENSSPSLIQSLGGRINPVCSCAFYELLFCFEGGKRSEFPGESPSGSAHPSALTWLWGGGADLGLGSQQHQPGLAMGIAAFQLQEGPAAAPAMLSGAEQVRGEWNSTSERCQQL